MKLSDIPTPELLRILHATERDTGPDSVETRILRRELVRREQAIRPLEWLDSRFRSIGGEIFSRPIGVKGSRELTTMVRAAILLWSHCPRYLQKASLDAIKYNLHNPEAAQISIEDALQKCLNQECLKMAQKTKKVLDAEQKARSRKKKEEA